MTKQSTHSSIPATNLKSFRKQLHRLICILFCLYPLLVSCMESPVQGDLLIHLGDASSRSIMPSSVKVNWIRISGTRNDNGTIRFASQSFEVGKPIAITGLSVGTWTFSVVGYGMDPALSGAFPLTSVSTDENVVIQSGQTTRASFALHYLTVGSGSAAITVTWPNGIPLGAKAVLGEVENSADLSTAGSALLPFSGLAVGDYSLDVELSNPSGTTICFPMIDMVNVFSGLESKGTVALVDADLPRAASPVITARAELAKGTPVYAYRTVTITGPEGSSLYYTTDRSEPGFSAVGELKTGTLSYTEPFDITAVGTTTIKAIAAKNGFLDSAVAAQDFVIIGLGDSGVVITDPVVVTDVVVTQADPAVAQFEVGYTAPENLQLTATWYMDGETIAATDIDGDGHQMTFTPALAEEGRHQVRVNLSYEDDGMTRTVSDTLMFTATKAQTPLISVSDTTGGKQISISGTATIYYTTDGSAPLSSSSRIAYESPFPLSETKTVRAFATQKGYVPSSEVLQEVEVLQVQEPIISVTPVAGGQQISISSATIGAVIHYTIDGSIPTTSSPVYSSSINVTSTKTIKAIAVESGMRDSLVATESVTVTQTTTPVITPAYTSFNGTLSVTISSESGAAIYYTTDGNTPTAANTLYSGPIAISENTTVKAIAVKLGLSNSSVASKVYTLRPVYKVGDIGPAGGKVFFVNTNYAYGNGWTYLEAAPSDMASTFKFGGDGIEISKNAQGTAIGTGNNNTYWICSVLKATEEYAAKACFDMGMWSNGKLYDDWFTPSKDELNLLYEFKNTNPSFANTFSASYYWSSSEYNSTGAWFQHFGTGHQDASHKYNTCRVRPIRAFE